MVTDVAEFRRMRRLYGELEIIVKELGMRKSNVLSYISCENTGINCNKTVSNVRHQYSGRKKNVAHTDLSSVGQPLTYFSSLKPWRLTRVYQCVRAFVYVYRIFIA